MQTGIQINQLLGADGIIFIGLLVIGRNEGGIRTSADRDRYLRHHGRAEGKQEKGQEKGGPWDEADGFEESLLELLRLFTGFNPR